MRTNHEGVTYFSCYFIKHFVASAKHIQAYICDHLRYYERSEYSDDTLSLFEVVR